MQVLVIEDDDDVTLLYRMALESAGHDVDTVRLGLEGIQRAEERPFDVIVLDGMLPDIDGLDVLSTLQRNERTASVPVVMASARVGTTDRQAALDAGASAYLVKPFEPTKIVQVVRDVARAGVDQDRAPRVPSSNGAAAPPRVNGAASPIVEPQAGRAGEPAAGGLVAQVLAAAVDAIVSIDEDQRIVGFNKGAETTFGYLAEEVLGKPLELLVPTPFDASHRDHVQRFADGAESAKIMGLGGHRYVYGRRRDGSEFPAEGSITKVRIDGRPVLTAILRDASERQRTEADLRTRADQHAAVAELGLRAITASSLTALLDDAVATVASVLGVELVKIALLDPETEDLVLTAGTGWRPGAVGAVRLATDRDTIVGTSLEMEEPVVFHDLHDDPRFRPDELLLRHEVTSGVHVTLRGRVRPVGLVGVYSRTPRLFTGDDVHVVQTIANIVSSGVLRDAHERRLRSFLDAAPDATLMIDAAGRIVSANAQAEELFGYSRDELMRMGVDALVPESAQARHSAHRAVYDKERRPRPMGAGLDLAARRRDGTEVPVDIMLRPLETEDGPLVVAAVRDVTERRRNEEARDSFLHAVSHELRTPLTAVLGFSALLSERFGDALSHDALDLVQRIRLSAGKLERLLTDLLDLDRLGRGVMEAQRRDVDVAALVAQTLETLNLEGRALEVTVDPGLRASVDPAQVERIIENLVVNAVRHTPVTSRIEVAISRSANGILLRVEDDGPGVPRELREQIFEPFRRAASGSFTPGTGIGLSLVTRFAELHGGRAWVEERPGGGASFQVVLAT